MTGDKCENCSTGWLVVANSRRQGDRIVRFHACWACNHRPAANKTSTIADPEPTRQRRRKRAS